MRSIFFVNLVVFSKVWRGSWGMFRVSFGESFWSRFGGQAEAASSASGQAVADKAYIYRAGHMASIGCWVEPAPATWF